MASFKDFSNDWLKICSIFSSYEPKIWRKIQKLVVFKLQEEKEEREKESVVTDVHLSSDIDIDRVPAISQDWNGD